jgi:hypothetical protein
VVMARRGAAASVFTLLLRVKRCSQCISDFRRFLGHSIGNALDTTSYVFARLRHRLSVLAVLYSSWDTWLN